MKKPFFAIIFSVIILINMLNIFSVTSKIITIASAKDSSTGYVKITVLESNTMLPVTNANVCIIETRKYTQTDKYGNTETIAVPIIRNNNFDISLKRDWGEFTILVYKQGYSTYISFYNEVYPNTTHIGLVCYLSPIINATDPPIISNASVPNSSYVSTLVKFYSK